MRFSATGHLMIPNNVIHTMYVCVCVAVVEVVIWDYFVYQNYVLVKFLPSPINFVKCWASSVEFLLHV